MRRRHRSYAGPLLGVAVALIGFTVAVLYFRPDLRPGWLPLELPASPASTTTLYRWRDASGQWVVSDTPPASPTPYETVVLRRDTNVLPSAGE